MDLNLYHTISKYGHYCEDDNLSLCGRSVKSFFSSYKKVKGYFKFSGIRTCTNAKARTSNCNVCHMTPFGSITLTYIEHNKKFTIPCGYMYLMGII